MSHCYLLGQFSVTSFIAATIWEYENYRTKMIQAMKKPLHSFRDNFQQRKGDLVSYLILLSTDYDLKFDDGTDFSSALQMSQIKATWNSLSPGDRFFVPICALNLLVFGLWRIPRLQTFMFKYFCSNPVASKCTNPSSLFPSSFDNWFCPLLQRQHAGQWCCPHSVTIRCSTFSPICTFYTVSATRFAWLWAENNCLACIWQLVLWPVLLVISTKQPSASPVYLLELYVIFEHC